MGLILIDTFRFGTRKRPGLTGMLVKNVIRAVIFACTYMIGMYLTLGMLILTLWRQFGKQSPRRLLAFGFWLVAHVGHFSSFPNSDLTLTSRSFDAITLLSTDSSTCLIHSPLTVRCYIYSITPYAQQRGYFLWQIRLIHSLQS